MYGIGAVGGMALAKLYLLDEDSCEVDQTRVVDRDKEYMRLLKSIEVSAKQLENIKYSASENVGQDNAEIFDYQLLMLEDDEFLDKIRNVIQNEHMNAEYAVDKVAKNYIHTFANINNDYLRERTSDIEDLAKRLNYALRGKTLATLSAISEDTVVAAADLTPSQTAGINREKVKGILLERGGKSSHSVIIARSLGIPCIVGIQGLLERAVHGDTVLINGDSGAVVISPDQVWIEEFKAYEMKCRTEKELLNRYVNCESKTVDGFEVKVFANITGESEVTALLENGGEGVGLFRTEFLYMAEKVPPSEDTQYREYSNIASKLGNRPLVIRTLDAGGDKAIPYLDIPKEENPFLGYRAIRYCLENPDLFKAQISAILRAGVHGAVEMMVPMISTIEELRRTKTVVNEVMEELSQRGIPYSDQVAFGMMVETPAAALMADRFAREVDFFSIGTNDLTQYLFAADRMNEKVADLNSYYHPALLKAIKYVCESANKQGIVVDICGQAGEVPELVPLWIAMGITNLSVSIPSIPKVRRIICETVKKEAVAAMETVMMLDTAQEVEAYLKSRGEGQ